MRLLTFVFLYYSTAISATLDCSSYVNFDQVGQEIVTTTLNEKVQVDRVNQATIYITELRPDYFVLEAFIPSIEIRVYSEAGLNKIDETIKTSLWDRNLLFDVICKKLK